MKTNKSKNNENNEQNATTLSVMPIVNDPQHRQLCAVHTINNLLQLTTKKNSTTTREDNADDTRTAGGEQRICKSNATTRSVLINGQLYKQANNVEFASKKELESIADEMSGREAAWMSGEEEERDANGCKTNAGNSQWWRSLRSNHRTVFTGNFSFSVLESALSKRDVALNWFKIENDTKPSDLTNYYDSANNDDDSSQNNVVVGYVINSKKEIIKPYSVKSLARAALAVGSSGRHWFAITKIRVVLDASHRDSGSESTMVDYGSSKSSLGLDSGEAIEYDKDKWFIVDSESRDDREIENNGELLEFLKEIITNDGNVFQAVTTSLHKVERNNF